VKISVEIVRSLCQAAGVFEYIRDVELARWTQKPVEAIPEKYTEFYSVLSMMSLAEAEQVMIKKSFLASMSCKAIAVICMDVFEKYRYTAGLLLSPGFTDTFTLINVHTYASFNCKMYELFAFKMTAYESIRQG
jgi:hypothetical protein